MNCLAQTLLTIGVVVLSYVAIAPHARRINEAVHPFFERVKEIFRARASA